jgi:hypothetical protein
MSDDDNDDCFGHEYEFQEALLSSSNGVYQELWVCIHCNHERILTHHIGIRD